MKNYIKGKYYSGLGTYLGQRNTHTQSKTIVLHHLFSTGERDSMGAVGLNKVFISETNQNGLVLNLARS